MKLRPSFDKPRIQTVLDIFAWFVTLGLSRREICRRLNAEGRTHYGNPWEHSDVTFILGNPAYTGDTVYGRHCSAELYTFRGDGIIEEVTDYQGPTKRDVADCVQKRDSHIGIVDRKTWGLAQDRLTRDERTNMPGRNPEYWLKPLLKCGHCGGNMTGRSYKNPATGEKVISYVCLNYVRAQNAGTEGACGYHAIKHTDAEALILGKLAELGAEYEAVPQAERFKLESTANMLGHHAAAVALAYADLLLKGAAAYREVLEQRFGPDVPEGQRLAQTAGRLLAGDAPLTVEEFRQLVKDTEGEAVRLAKAKLAEAKAEHKRLTLKWAKASEDQEAVLKEECDRLEGEARRWEAETVPLWERVEKLDAELTARLEEVRELRDSWPKLEGRARSEALRRLVARVSLKWVRTHHKPNNPRPKKTDRNGRYSYALDRDGIGWEFTSNLDGTCCRGTCSRSGR